MDPGTCGTAHTAHSPASRHRPAHQQETAHGTTRTTDSSAHSKLKKETTAVWTLAAGKSAAASWASAHSMKRRSNTFHASQPDSTIHPTSVTRSAHAASGRRSARNNTKGTRV